MRLIFSALVVFTSAGCGGSSDEGELFATGGSGGQSSGGASGADSGGTSAGGAASGGTAGAGGTSFGGAAGAAGMSSGGTSSGGAGSGGTPPVGGAGGCATKTWCLDSDGDGYGAGSPKSGCTSPGAGWIEAGSKASACDDCADQHPDVHPDNNVCSDKAYSANGGLSYDYDCDGSEVECGSFVKAETCKVQIGSCSGSGYLPVNGKYCGSMQYQKCEIAVPPTSCKTSVVNAAALKCK